MADCKHIIRLVEPGWTGVEIGVQQGHSSVLFLEMGCFMYLVDPYRDYAGWPERESQKGLDDQYRDVCVRLRPYAGRFELLRLTAEEAAPRIPDGVDFVFIDGNHMADYVRADIERYWPKVRPGGWLTGHDYVMVPGWCEVQPVVDDFVRRHPEGTLRVIGGSWAIQKPEATA